MMTLDELARLFDEAAVQCRPRLEADLARIGELAQTMAVEYIGREMPEWPALAPSTVAQKRREGFVGRISATDPLYRTGYMRDSIKVKVDDLAVVVGSQDKVASYQEMGTSRIPPRPFLSLSMSRSVPYATERLGETAVSLLTGKAIR